MADVAAHTDPGQTDKSNTNKLSTRELEILSMLVRGKSNAEIAAEFDLSERTVYDHITGLKQKLDVSSRADLLRYVREHGLR
jgi:DNA-binding NarL/FixJ family response regulator